MHQKVFNFFLLKVKFNLLPTKIFNLNLIFQRLEMRLFFIKMPEAFKTNFNNISFYISFIISNLKIELLMQVFWFQRVFVPSTLNYLKLYFYVVMF